MRRNHQWVAPNQRRPIDPIFVLQAIGAAGMLVVGLGIVALIIAGVS